MREVMRLAKAVSAVTAVLMIVPSSALAQETVDSACPRITGLSTIATQCSVAKNDSNKGICGSSCAERIVANALSIGEVDGDAVELEPEEIKVHTEMRCSL